MLGTSHLSAPRLGPSTSPLLLSMMMAMELGYYAAMRSFRLLVEAKRCSLKPDMRAQRDRIICAYSLESLANGIPANMVLIKAYFFHRVRLHVRSLPNEEQRLGVPLDRIFASVANEERVRLKAYIIIYNNNLTSADYRCYCTLCNEF